MGLTGAENFHKLVGFHMASQGLISMARGDGFVQGAVSGFIGKISGPILQGIESDVTSSVIAGVFGGVASKATGGDFLQGALQAATVHLYNQRGGKAAEKRRNLNPLKIIGRAAGKELRDFYNSVKLSGVLAVGTEGTVAEGFFGLKGGSGFYYDFSKGEWGYYSDLGAGLSGINDNLIGGLDFQVSITFDYAPSMDYFSGTSVETGYSIGFFGIDYTVVPSKGAYWGVDIGVGIGSSVVKTETQAWSF